MSNETRAPSRRMVLRVAGVAVTVTFLAGCGASGGKNGGTAPGQDTEAVQTAVESAITQGTVPVGGAQFLKDAGVVVTQPAQGDYKVFSDVCPHQNGRVSIVAEGTGNLVCTLHGSQFDPVTGEVKVGPAATGLAPIDVAVPGAN